MGGGIVVIVFFVVVLFAVGAALAILFSRRRSRFGSKGAYAILAIIAPFALFTLAVSLPKWLPEWVMKSVFLVGFISPYLVRVAFVSTPKTKGSEGRS